MRATVAQLGSLPISTKAQQQTLPTSRLRQGRKRTNLTAMASSPSFEAWVKGELFEVGKRSLGWHSVLAVIDYGIVKAELQATLVSVSAGNPDHNILGDCESTYPDFLSLVQNLILSLIPCLYRGGDPKLWINQFFVHNGCDTSILCRPILPQGATDFGREEGSIRTPLYRFCP